MFPEAQAEHRWLDPLVGQWAVKSECQMGPGQPPMLSESTLNVRTLGQMWIVGEGDATSPEGGSWKSILSVGYDPAKGQYVGTFIASMMPSLWIYTGTIDESGKRLVLDTEGPTMDGQGMAPYQDIIEIVDDNHWILSSQILMEGNWTPFMKAEHQRV